MTSLRHDARDDTQPYVREVPVDEEHPDGFEPPVIPRWLPLAGAVLLGFVVGAIVLSGGGGGTDSAATSVPLTVVPVERAPVAPVTAATAPTTALSAASSTTQTTVVPIQPVDLGGFEEGTAAPAGRWVAHQPGSEIGPWLVGVTVVRDRAEIHNPGLQGHVLNLRADGSISRIVEGLQPGYRYRLELDVARHNLVALGSASARVVVGDQSLDVAPDALSSQAFDRAVIEFVPEHQTVAVQVTGTGSSIGCCGVVVDNLTVIPVADADGNLVDPLGNHLDGTPATESGVAGQP